jgi:hypothetical protein
MLKPAEPRAGQSGDELALRELVNRLVEDGKDYARAEFGLVKAMASAKARALAIPAGMIVAAIFFIQAAVTVLAVATFLAFLPLVGPFFAGLIAFLLFAGIAGALGWFAVQKIGSGR